MELTAHQVWDLLQRSRLLAPDTAQALYPRWKESHNGGTGQEFAHWLVSQGFLTEYQSNLLLKGHATGFFLGQYKIVERLGKGRMAGVYKAVHESGQVVAIKVLPPSRAKDPVLLARFQREARLALMLKHPNIVRSYQLCTTDELHYIVMEYLEGETLDDVIGRRGRFPPVEAVRLAYQAFLGLQHIHEQGLVHRDLKPANLMLVPAAGPGDSTLACTIKILDIGLGRALFDEAGPLDQSEKPGDAELTGTNVLLGTPDYLSPEQARDPHSADIRSDMYSLGCVLYHLLAGQTVFPDTNLINQMVRHATEAPQPLRPLNPAVSDELQQIVDRLLAKDPTQRFGAPYLAAQALHGLLSGGLDRVASPEPTPQMQQYLIWLEESGPIAVGSSKKSSEPEAAAKPPRSTRSGSRKRRKKSRATPAAAPSASSEKTPSLDVVLVAPSRPAAPRPAPKPEFQLTWRDLIFFGFGVFGTCLAFALAFLASRLLH